MIIDGKKEAQLLRDEIKKEIESLKSKNNKVPGLTVILIGDFVPSQIYVKNKERNAKEVGINSDIIRYAKDVSEQEVLKKIKELNNNEAVSGILVQLPLPPQINKEKIINAINPLKDVDGFHPANFGRMAQGLPAYLPATPFGIMQMLDRYNIDVEGKECVVLGRSNIVGTPISILLSRKARPGNATVSLCHSRTKDLKSHTLRADIIIAAIGIPEFLTADMVKDGVVIIDVGINRVNDENTKRGYRLAGDVKYEEVAAKASYITPVPGGVGPMTVTSLLMNTLKSCRGEVYGK